MATQHAGHARTAMRHEHNAHTAMHTQTAMHAQPCGTDTVPTRPYTLRHPCTHSHAAWTQCPHGHAHTATRRWRCIYGHALTVPYAHTQANTDVWYAGALLLNATQIPKPRSSSPPSPRLFLTAKMATLQTRSSMCSPPLPTTY
eukprot:366561-Chlamydomonas_euryale.AAC.2